ncbi:MAG TPA: ATP-binding protein, partial [Pyrinomonadaceae bacterium]|nr:ATP-binding protein [Pyrinomonadaceae bacterium]
FLLGACALALLLVELLLSGFGVALRYRLLLALTGGAAISYAGVREFNRVFNDLRSIRAAIDDTARGEFESAIQVTRLDEVGILAEAVLVMRERLAELSRHLVESLRMESLHILGSILVHDMKNLSFRLRCLSQNLADNYADPAFRESLARTLNDTTEQMDQMVKRFREQKEMIIIKLRINLNEVVRSALGKLRRDTTRIHISEQYGQLPLVWADTVLIENAIFNIIDNALDAMPHGGQLTVRTRLIEDEGNSHRQAVVEIADTGVGMSEEFVQSDLFAPFVTTKPRGLGLGLYTCRQIIQMHHGEIKVKSVLGRGTVFKIHLPITD